MINITWSPLCCGNLPTIDRNFDWCCAEHYEKRVTVSYCIKLQIISLKNWFDEGSAIYGHSILVYFIANILHKHKNEDHNIIINIYMNVHTRAHNKIDKVMIKQRYNRPVLYTIFSLCSLQSFGSPWFAR